MKITVTGASGLIGSALVPALRADGHEVLRLVRRTPRVADEAEWHPERRWVDTAALVGTDAAVHLAGVGIGDRRWSAAHKRRVLASRVDGTETLSAAMAGLDPRPRLLLSASAIGWYGDTGGRVVDETGPLGAGFAADVVRQWEDATLAAETAGIRVIHLRSGIVLSGRGGALGKVLRLFRLGLGGRLGSGRQCFSWISLPDELAAIRFLLGPAGRGLTGPVNLSAPNPVTNARYTAAIAAAVHRPAVLVVPRFALRLVLGGFADEGVLISQQVAPGVLTRAGFEFRYGEIEPAVRAVV